MASLNRAQILGHVGKDPEIRSMTSGDRVANFSIATSESWKDKTSGEKKEATSWHNIVVWGPLVEIIEKYVKKGSKLYIEGKIQTRKYEQNGIDKYTTEIVMRGFDSKMIMLDGKMEGSAHSGGGGSDNAPMEDDENSIPF